MSINILLKSIGVLLLFFIIYQIVNIKSSIVIRRRPVSRLVVAGALFMALALIVQISAEFKPLDFSVFGVSSLESIADILFLAGFLFLGAGFRKWAQVLKELEYLEGELKTSNQTLSRQTAELRLREDMYESITSAATDAIFMINAEGRIVFCNPAVATIFGYEDGELLGHDLHSLLAPARYRDDFARGFGRFMHNGSGKAVRHTIQAAALKKDGREFPMEVSVSPIFYNESWHALGILRDISEQVEHERQNADLARQLRRAQKMEAIGTLAGGIAHDFNNILTAILGYGELARHAVPADKGAGEYIELVLQAGRRARDLVRQILFFSRQQEQERQPISPHLIVNEVLKLLRASLPATIEINQSIDNCAQIMSDPTLLHQVLMNLCTNAAHAMENKNGRLTVELACVAVSAADLPEGGEFKPASYVRLRVSDTGCGIAEDVKERIFDPYFTTKEVGKGTGLGLSVVQGIVSSHGGWLTVDSVVGEGTSFAVYLPVIESETVPLKNGRAVDARLAINGGESLLFVDDEEIIADLGRLLLERLGYRVTALTSGNEALKIFKKSPEDYDLLIVDQVMPGLSGMQLAQEVMAIKPEMAVIICTGNYEQLNEEEAMAQGIRAVVMKPIVEENLAPVIRKVFAE
ncbi:MAG TPA: PAS domain S-box protein [Desulfobacterales bacterium]|nr:PAS domain S-box protein [Desulfobacterales bacterium]